MHWLDPNSEFVILTVLFLGAGIILAILFRAC